MKSPQPCSLTQTTLLIKRTRYGTCLSSSSRLQSPASPWDYSHKPVTSSRRNQGASHPFDARKPASHQPWLLTALLCGLGGMRRLPPLGWECVTHKLLSASSVQGWLSRTVRTPRTPGQEFFPRQQGCALLNLRGEWWDSGNMGAKPGDVLQA